MSKVERREHERKPFAGKVRVFDEEIITDGLTYRRIVSHLKQASKDGRRREQMRCRIALRTIARFRKECHE